MAKLRSTIGATPTSEDKPLMTTLKPLAVSSWDLSKAPRNLRFLVDDEGNLISFPVVPVDPTLTSPIQPIGAFCVRDPTLNSGARCFGLPAAGFLDSDVGLITNAREMIYAPYISKWVGVQESIKGRAVSAVNTAQTITLYMYQIRTPQHLEAYIVCSAGTCTVNVEITTNGTDYLTIHSLAAASPQLLHFDIDDVGGTIGVSPLPFPVVRLQIGAAGAGNTTTCTYVVK